MAYIGSRRALLSSGAITPDYDLNFLAGATSTDLAAKGFAFARSGVAYDEDGNSFADGVPRIVASKGFFFEGAARTNSCLWSQGFNNAAWSRNQLGISANVTTAPDGTATGDAFPASVTTSQDHFTSQTSIAISANANSTLSVYVKPGAVSWCYLSLFDQNSVGARNYYNLSGAGSVGSAENFNAGTTLGTGIVAANNGWYRIWIARAGVAGQTSMSIRIGPANADLGRTYSAADTTTAQFSAWQAQVELGVTVPSSPILTTAAAVTRNADSISAARSSAILRQGTVIIEGTTGLISGTSQYLWAIDDGTGNNRSAVTWNTGRNIESFLDDATVSQADITLSTVSDLTNFKTAWRWSASNYAAVLNGGSVSSDTSGTVPTMTTERLGNSVAADRPMFGYIRRMRRYRTALGDAFLINAST